MAISVYASVQLRALWSGKLLLYPEQCFLRRGASERNVLCDDCHR